jgi:site-specific recombinase
LCILHACEIDPSSPPRRARLDPCRAPAPAAGQRELPKLARHLCNLTASADLPDRLDAWLALNRWLAGGALWSDVYIDAADVHGSATQRFAVLMDVLAATPALAAEVRDALCAILDETDGANLFGEVGIPATGVSCRSSATG